jgi:hypothetical protein
MFSDQVFRNCSWLTSSFFASFPRTAKAKESRTEKKTEQTSLDDRGWDFHIFEDGWNNDSGNRVKIRWCYAAIQL